LAVIVTLTLAVTAGVWGYHAGHPAARGSRAGGHPAVVTRLSLDSSARHAAAHESYAMPRQIPVLCFHGIGTPSTTPGSVNYYNVTLANFTSEMAYLHRHGYATITPQQYANWLAGIRQLLPAKPILLTFDDAFVSDTEATPVLNKYGFSAVMFVITGYANGDFGSVYAGWSTIETMARQGWITQLHAGECGHAFLPYAPAPCLAGLHRSLMTPTHFEYYIWRFGQTNARYKARVVNDITVGEAAIQTHLSFTAGWQSTVFAAPFGAWANGQDRWLISYWSRTFKVVFVQHISASDQVVAHAHSVRYRLELGYRAQSMAFLRSRLRSAAFTRAGARPGVTVGSPSSVGSG
jgi:peptidoglycan/xylan/chitin deacetylase (PgdA/CDA1 family)